MLSPSVCNGSVNYQLTNMTATTINPSTQESIASAPPAAKRRVSFWLFSFNLPMPRTEAAEHMRPDHFLCLILAQCLQAVVLLAAGTNPTGSVTTTPLAVLALVLPFGCYMWGLRGAPMGFRTSRPAVRFTVLVLVAIVLSLGGFVVGLASFATSLP